MNAAKKKVTVTLQQLSIGDYQVQKMTNAISLQLNPIVRVGVGQQITQMQADELCQDPDVEVIVKAMEV